MRAVAHTRPRSSIIWLWVLVWLSQIGSAPQIGRRRHRVGAVRRRVRVAHRVLHFGRDLLQRVEHRPEVGAVLRRAIKLAIRVDRRLAPVGRDQIVHVRRRAAPVPEREDEVALEALRPLRLRERKLARGDAVCPVRPQREPALRADARRGVDHLRHRLARGDAPRPRFARLHVGEVLRHRARSLGAERVARHAAVGFHGVQPFGLRFHPTDRELAFLGDSEHGIPVDRRVVFGRRSRARRHGRLEIQRPSGLGLHLRGIHQAISANPHVVARPRQIRDRIAAALVGHHDLREARRQVGRFGNDPNARFRAVGARHDAREIGAALDRKLAPRHGQ